jgi:hypothetical protein
MEERLDNYDSPLVRQRRKSIHFRLLGILPLLFFLLQGIHYWRIAELGHMLWMCNIGNLVLALGLFWNKPAIIRVSVLWTIPGLVVWIIYVVLEWGVFFSSTLAHVGGFVTGLIALRKVGMDRQAWFHALLWYFVVQVLSRLLTPAKLNVNVSHAVDQGWRGSFDSYWKFWLVLTFSVAACLWVLGIILAKVFPIKASNQQTAVTSEPAPNH